MVRRRPCVISIFEAGYPHWRDRPRRQRLRTKQQRQQRLRLRPRSEWRHSCGRFLNHVLSVLVDPIKEHVLSPVETHISYAFEWEKGVQMLQNDLEMIKDKKDSVQEDVDDAIRRGECIHEKVPGWLRDADKAIGVAEELLQQKDIANNKCFFGLCPRWKRRYQLGKKAYKRVHQNFWFCYSERIKVISYTRIFKPSMLSTYLLPSRVLMSNQIMDALKDPSLNVIGIYGVGGVGKTTLAERVSARARAEGLFDDVIMIAVSQFPSLRRIQAEIAAFLGLKFDTEEVVGRARQLYERLERAKLLIVLDDVRQKLDFHSVGIPIGAEGCKLLVSSRRKDVLSREMGSQEDFLVDVLSGEESWSLLKSITPEVEDASLNAITVDIIQKCAGLPLLVELVSLQLKQEEINSRVDMLKQLRELKNEDLPERVSKVVESSFDNLPGEELKSLLLLCASCEQPNVPIQQLLIYGIGLHLFRNITTIKEANSVLWSMMQRLAEDGLLLNADLVGYVKLLDAVRDDAISIASRFQKWFIGAGETRLGDWPNKDCTRISVRVFNIQDLPASLQCPKAELFLLSSEDLCLEFPDLFFQGLADLKVVGITGIGFVTKLPSSLGFLRNLDTLSLHRCQLDDISVIGELAELKLLSFAGSDLVELPREMKALTVLKLLDLTDCSKLRTIPRRVISKLISLEELLMRNTYVRWDEEGNARLLELEKLSCLSSLEIQIVNPKSMPKFNSFYDGLHRCKIIIGEECGREKFERSKMLKLIKTVSTHLEHAVWEWFRRTEDLYLDEVSKMASVLDYLAAWYFPQVRKLCIKNESDIQYVIGQDRRIFGEVFPVLESLRLDNLNSLKAVFNGQLDWIRCLQSVKVSNCGKLKNLFSHSTAEELPVLREMEVESCEKMEAIIGEGYGEINFTKLTSLKLKNLPHLRGFCIGEMKTEITFPELKIVEVTKCRSLKHLFRRSNVKRLQKLERLKITNCESMEDIIWPKENEEAEEDKYLFPSLVELSIHNCPALVINTGSEGAKYPLGENERLYNLDGKRFPWLMHLNIQNGYGSQHNFNLNGLNHLVSLYIDELRRLNGSHCSKLKNLFSFSSTKCFKEVLEMEVRSCHKMEAIVGGRSENEILELTQLRSLKLENLPHLRGFCQPKEGTRKPEILFNKMVSFPNLTSLVIEKCDTLKYVFTLPMVQCLVQLKKLEISNCELVEAIIQSNKIEENKEEIINKIVLNKLDSLSLFGLPNAKMFSCGYEIKFPFLREIFVECPAMENFVSKFSDRNNNYNDDDDEYLFNELVTFCNLESVVVRNMGTFTYLWHEKFALDGSLLKLKSVTISSCSRLSLVFPTSSLGRIQKLEETECGRINIEEEYALRDVQLEEKEVYANEEVVEFPQLLSLKLKNLPYLSGFGIQVSFPTLKDMEVCQCKKLKYVFTPTAVNSLMKLEKLEINDCESVEEIILSRQFDEVESFDKIVFPKLEYLSLEKLPNLKTFDFGYPVEFQSLKELSISYCPVLRNFVSKFSVNSSDEYLFNEMVIFSSLERMEVCHAYSFEYLWDEQFTAADSFFKLKSLRIEYCSKLRVIFPSNICTRFQGLETLHLCCCSRAEEVYRFEGSFEEFNSLQAFSLQDLEILNLPSLKRIWSNDPAGASTFEFLQSVKVVSCKDLMFVFPKSIARRLLQLQHLEIGDSHVDVIIANTNAEESDFLFPQLSVLQLENLYQMRSLHEGPHTFTCPKLKQLDIYGCHEAMNFFSQLTSLQLRGFGQVLKLGSKISAYYKEKSLPLVKNKLIHNLEEVTLDDQGLKLILSVDHRVRYSKVKQVTMRSLDEESIPLLFGFLGRCNLKKLVFVESYLEEIFFLDDAETMPEHLMLQNLEVVGDENLKHVFKKDSRLNTILVNLLTLNIEFCERMINIAPSRASFRNLTSLNISACFKMKNLVTVSTAKTMKNLRELKISKCSMMEEIVENDSDVESISFDKLKFLELHDLPTLKSFSSRTYNLNFPLLKQVVVEKCFSLKNFCRRKVGTPKLHAIQFQGEKCWKGDLNATIAYLVKSRVVDTES